MTTFDDRQTAYEGKFARDADTEFKVQGRRNRLLGHWAAAKLGLSGEALDAYVRSVIVADLKEAGHEDVLGKVIADLAGHADEAEIRTRYHLLLEEARSAVQADA